MASFNIRIRTGCLVALALLIAMPLSADEFEDFAKSEMGSFAQYRDERDAEFVNFLKAQWAEFDASRGVVRDSIPKPSAIPVAKPPAPVTEGEEDGGQAPPEPATPVGEIVLPALPPSLPPEPVALPGEDGEEGVTPAPAEPPVVVVPVPEPDVLVVPEEPSPFDEPSGVEPEMIPVGLSVSFFGANHLFRGEFSFPEASLTPPLKPAIAAYWEAMSQSAQFEAFLSQARDMSGDLGLNDWGYHNFLFTCGLAVHGNDRDLANLFTWFMSVKSGYDARVGYSDDRVYLLLPSRNTLYSVSYLTLQGTRYYAVTFDGSREKLGKLYTYKGKYPKADRLMDYRLLKVPTLKPEITEKELRFEYGGEPQSVKVSYNQSLVDYYRYYPQTNIKIYFDALTSDELNYSMVRELKEKLEGKSEKEAVDYLLGFSQKAFAYKTDDDQLGREKYMLPEETIWYPYSDCEDRSFLFAYLVRRILKLDVVGLNYPGHVATAVRFNDNVPGDYVVMNNRKYIVCDPTYINASAGMAMPKYKRRNPDVVKIRNWQ
ncbi:hypothetical protein [Desulfoluna butyratoxydans]|uniref:Transglutaminase-like domain-containing protein n=1 Tax=Desulfoluna butyratoxydans TaxID=231438 RepID=A0A4U8YNB0_9BACT|nr:hypothetical protein [Desulfoluna butyratoxydans]VFQ45290.1 hypothetical protein MSL71_29470 [Desulfoluna butyratoxydans]